MQGNNLIQQLNTYFMFWDDEEDGEDMQRFKNYGFLKLPFTNKTRDEIFNSPGFGIAMIIILILIIIIVALVIFS